MNRKKDTAYGINRLESKNARAAIIQKISADFNLMPLVAEAYYKQLSTYFEQHADVHLTSGQICYEAVAAEEPAGKHIALAKKVSCRLKLNDVEADLEVLATYGLAGLRQRTSGAITHKKEIITLYLQGHLTPRIAAKTKHAKEAVDRYIRDYESVKVVRNATADIDTISQITRLSKRVITQYLDLIPQPQLQTMDANLTNSTSNDETGHQGETQ